VRQASDVVKNGVRGHLDRPLAPGPAQVLKRFVVKHIRDEHAFPAIAYRACHPAVVAVYARGHVAGEFFQVGRQFPGLVEHLVPDGRAGCHQGGDRRGPAFGRCGRGQRQLFEQGLALGALGRDQEFPLDIHPERADQQVRAVRYRMLAGAARGGQVDAAVELALPGQGGLEERGGGGLSGCAGELEVVGVFKSARAIDAHQDDIVRHPLLELDQFDVGPYLARPQHNDHFAPGRLAGQARNQLGRIHGEGRRQGIGLFQALGVGHQHRHHHRFHGKVLGDQQGLDPVQRQHGSENGLQRQRQVAVRYGASCGFCHGLSPQSLQMFR
jgi:hypothetical protein